MSKTYREVPKKRNNVAYGFVMAEMGKSAGPHRDKRDKRSKNPRGSWRDEHHYSTDDER